MITTREQVRAGDDSSAATAVGQWQNWAAYAIGLALLIAIAIFANGQFHQSDNYRVIGSFWASGDAANHHLNPYAVQPRTSRLPIKQLNVEVDDGNLNPPVLLPAFQLLALLPIGLAATVFTSCSVACFAGAAAIIIATHRQLQRTQAAWILLSAPIIPVIIAGQI